MEMRELLRFGAMAVLLLLLSCSSFLARQSRRRHPQDAHNEIALTK